MSISSWCCKRTHHIASLNVVPERQEQDGIFLQVVLNHLLSSHPAFSCSDVLSTLLYLLYRLLPSISHNPITNHQQWPQPSPLPQPLHRNRPNLCSNLRMDTHTHPHHFPSLNPYPRRPSLLLQPRDLAVGLPLPRLWRLAQLSAQNRARQFRRPSNLLHRCSPLVLPPSSPLRRIDGPRPDHPAQSRAGSALARPG